jgi:hypothetical protein
VEERPTILWLKNIYYLEDLGLILHLRWLLHIDCTSNIIEETTAEEVTPEIMRLEELQERIVDDADYINTMSVSFSA